MLAERYAFSVRLGLYGKILRSDWERLSSYHSGDILTRVTTDVETATDGITYVFPGVITLTVRLVADSASCISTRARWLSYR